MTKSELIFYIDILEDLNGKRLYVNYENLKHDLLVEFSIKTTIEFIKKALTARLEQRALDYEVEDLKMMYMNVS